MKQGYFITGTDTGVGKTLIASSLIRHFAQQGLRSAGMKPVAAGCELKGGRLVNEDVEALLAASNIHVPIGLVNPYAFVPSVAPHIAAEQAGVEVELEVIIRAYQQLGEVADVVVVEGAGGFCVPLSDKLDMAALAQALNLPVIMVVGMRLGCISHALLTAEAIGGRGLTLAGWIANQIDPKMSAFEDNIKALEQRISAPCIGIVGWDQLPVYTI